MAFTSALSSQIVNIEERRLKNEDGWKGNIALNFSFTKNSKEILEIENLSQISYRKFRNFYMFINEIEVIRQNNSDVLNNGFQHLRYNYRFTKLLLMEAFAQHQFNQIQRIDRRVLLGVGPRFELINNDSLKLNVGTHVMREWEKTSKGGEQNNYRSSNYFSINWQINKILNLSSTTYYQPKFDNFYDYRVSNNTVFTIGITQKLGIRFTYELLYDTKVPEGVPSTVYSLQTGITYVF